MITGANAGIGFATAKQLAGRGAHVILVCRDLGRGKAALEELSRTPLVRGATAPILELAQCDLASLRSVRNFTKAFNSRNIPLHLLICNAGAMAAPERHVTIDGHEAHYQVNFLSHWLLTNNLVSEQIRRRGLANSDRKSGDPPSSALTAPGSSSSGSSSSRPAEDLLPDGSCRVLFLTSLMHHAGKLQWEDKQSVSSYSPFQSYAMTKLAALVTAKELQRRFKSLPPNLSRPGDCAVGVHPGVVLTELCLNFFTEARTNGVSKTDTATSSPAGGDGLARNGQGSGPAGGQGLSLSPAGVVSGLKSAVTAVMNAGSPIIMKTPLSSARDTVMWAVTAPSGLVGGSYVADGGVADGLKESGDLELGKRLWDETRRLTGVEANLLLS
ncbi:MAG: hypothetical protein WDW38_002640 [Sanguina aurantia]